MKVQQPLIGHSSGSLGDMVFQTYHGVTVMHTKSTNYHYPDTPSQQICQAKFYDIQRVWLPIYYELVTCYSVSQRYNRNIFNELSKGIFQVFNPFSNQSRIKPPKNFGVDSLNRVVADLGSVSYTLTKQVIEVHFDGVSISQEVDGRFIWIHYLVCNRSHQNLYYRRMRFSASTNYFGFTNTNDWDQSDEIYFYAAVESDTWMGNFNLQNT